MVNTSKIDKYDLGYDVLELRSRGLSLEDIANQLRYEHRDNSDIQSVNPMTISRWLRKKSVQEYRKELMEGKNPEDKLREELRARMEDWEDETHEIYLLMKDSLKKIAKEGDDWKTIKASKDLLGAIEQSRKNLVTQVEEGFQRFGRIHEAKEINFVQVNNLLMGVTDLLCNECKAKLIKHISNMEEK